MVVVVVVSEVLTEHPDTVEHDVTVIVFVALPDASSSTLNVVVQSVTLDVVHLVLVDSWDDGSYVGMPFHPMLV